MGFFSLLSAELEATVMGSPAARSSRCGQNAWRLELGLMGRDAAMQRLTHGFFFSHSFFLKSFHLSLISSSSPILALLSFLFSFFFFSWQLLAWSDEIDGCGFDAGNVGQRRSGGDEALVEELG
jgi:hypothetical protein